MKRIITACALAAGAALASPAFADCVQVTRGWQSVNQGNVTVQNSCRDGRQVTICMRLEDSGRMMRNGHWLKPGASWTFNMVNFDGEGFYYQTKSCPKGRVTGAAACGWRCPGRDAAYVATGRTAAPGASAGSSSELRDKTVIFAARRPDGSVWEFALFFDERGRLHEHTHRYPDGCTVSGYERGDPLSAGRPVKSKVECDVPQDDYRYIAEYQVSYSISGGVHTFKDEQVAFRAFLSRGRWRQMEPSSSTTIKFSVYGGACQFLNYVSSVKNYTAEGCKIVDGDRR